MTNAAAGTATPRVVARQMVVSPLSKAWPWAVAAALVVSGAYLWQGFGFAKDVALVVGKFLAVFAACGLISYLLELRGLKMKWVWDMSLPLGLLTAGLFGVLSVINPAGAKIMLPVGFAGCGLGVILILVWWVIKRTWWIMLLLAIFAGVVFLITGLASGEIQIPPELGGKQPVVTVVEYGADRYKAGDFLEGAMLPCSRKAVRVELKAELLALPEFPIRERGCASVVMIKKK